MWFFVVVVVVPFKVWTVTAVTVEYLVFEFIIIYDSWRFEAQSYLDEKMEFNK